MRWQLKLWPILSIMHINKKCFPALCVTGSAHSSTVGTHSALSIGANYHQAIKHGIISADAAVGSPLPLLLASVHNAMIGDTSLRVGIKM